jgi:hypothetical protein
MFSIASESQSLERHANRFTVEALAGALPQRWVIQAIAESGRVAKRVRQLPDVLTAWIVILLGLYRRQSYRNLLEMLFEAGHHRGLWADRGAPTTSALVKARDRLGVLPLRLLFEESARRWVELVAGAYFAGRRVFAMDGTTFKVPDTASNRDYFGLPGSSRGRAGYPQFRMVSLRDVGSRMTCAAQFGPYRTGEMTLARNLLECIPAASLVLMDRNFMAYDLLYDMHEQGVDFLVRVKEVVKSTVVIPVGHGDAIVRIDLPRHWRKERPDLPRTWLLREVRYLPKGGTEVIRLFTTLMLDAEITRKQLADLYPQRWQEETAYDEIKTHQLNSTTITQPTHLRSQSPERVEQEFYGLLIAHNAVRFTMAQAAEISHRDPIRLSFTAALTRIRESVRDMMRSAALRLHELFRRLLDVIGRAWVPPRTGRSHPRAVKIKMSGYPRRRYAMP